MWVIHFVGMPKTGKTELAKAVGALLGPFAQSLGAPIKYIEMPQLVEQWYDSAKIDKKTTSLLYTDKAPKELVALYYAALDPKAVNIVVGAREAIFMDMVAYWTQQADKTLQIWQNGVKVLASTSARRTRMVNAAEAAQFEADEKAEVAFGLPAFLDSVWQGAVVNEDLTDLATAPIKVIESIFRHVELAAVAKKA